MNNKSIILKTGILTASLVAGYFLYVPLLGENGVFAGTFNTQPKDKNHSLDGSNHPSGKDSNDVHVSHSSAVHLEADVFNRFLSKHCTKCHGPKKQKGDTRLDTLSLNISDGNTALHWQEVLDVLNLGDMPPEEEDQPSKEELQAIIKHLTIALDTSKKRLSEDGGNIALRRINRREYRQTVEQLLGMNVPEVILPADSITEGYDTVGQDQQFSSHHFDDYFGTAKSVATVALQWADKEQPASKTTTTPAAGINNKRMRKKMSKYQKILDHLKAGGSPAGLGNVRRVPGLIAPLNKYFAQPHVNEGAYIFEGTPYPHVNSHRFNTDPRATYKFKVKAGLTGVTPAIRHFLTVITQGDEVGYLKVSGSIKSPETNALEYRPNFSDDTIRITVRESKVGKSMPDYLTQIGDKSGKAAMWVKELIVEGPFYNEPSALETIYKQTIATVDASKSDNAKELDLQAKQFLKAFMNKAFRGRSTASEYEKLVFKIYSLERGQGKTVKESLITPLAMILSSPSFLYLMEDDAATEDGLVSEVEFANRISHFLWSRSASGELLADAKAGKLKEKAVLKKHIDSMLKHKNSLALSEGFFNQWVDMERFESIGIDQNAHVKFNKGLRHSAKLEVQHFFHTLVKENLSLTQLIDSDFVVINDLLATHYGLKGPNKGGEFHKVKLPTDSPRGGLLGTVAFLTMGSNGERASPIIRGALIQEKFFNRKPPPPPPNVPELENASKEPLPIKETIAMHRKKAQCASCHNSFDPLGYGLENFDLVGIWHTQETVGHTDNKPQEVKGKKIVKPAKPTLIPVRSEGVFPNKKPFKNLDEFRTGLIAHKHLLTRSISEGLLSYGLGRHIEFADQQALDEICNQASQNNEQIGDLIYSIISHPLFRKADPPTDSATSKN